MGAYTASKTLRAGKKVFCVPDDLLNSIAKFLDVGDDSLQSCSVEVDLVSSFRIEA